MGGERVRVESWPAATKPRMIPTYLPFRQPPGWQRAKHEAFTEPTALPAADDFVARPSRGDRAGDDDAATCVTLGAAAHLL